MDSQPRGAFLARDTHFGRDFVDSPQSVAIYNPQLNGPHYFTHVYILYVYIYVYTVYSVDTYIYIDTHIKTDV